MGGVSYERGIPVGLHVLSILQVMGLEPVGGEELSLWELRRSTPHAAVEKSSPGYGIGAVGVRPYRGTSLIRNSPPLGPYGRNKPRALW